MALRGLLAMLAAAASLVAAACGEDDEPPVAPLDSAGTPAVSEPAESDPAVPEAAVPEPASTRLFLAGEGELAVVDVDTESTRVLQVDQLAAGDPPYRIVRRGNELVVYGGDTYAVDLELETTPRKVHKSWFFIPAAAEDRVWVAILDPGSPDTVRALSAVVEVTADGVVTSPSAHPPGGRWPIGAVSAGLLFERETGGLELWDPRRGTVIRELPAAWPGPTHGNLLAWCVGGGPTWGASLHLTDVVGRGDRWRIDPPTGFAAFRCWDGAFAPDGKTLAVPVMRRRDLSAQHALALVDVQSGRSTVIEGSAVPAGYVFVAWASSGEQVFLTGGQRPEPRRIVAYRLGDDHARELAVEVPDFYGIAAS